MKKIVIALTVVLAFMLAPLGGTNGAAQAGWCDKHAEKAFCVKKEARKAKREARKALPSPGVATKEHTPKGTKFRGNDQNVTVNVVQQGGGDRDRDRSRGRGDGRGDGWGRGRGDGWGRGRGGYDPSVAIVGGILGGFIGNVFAPKPEPQVVVVQAPAPAPEGPAPWTPDWYNYCNAKYRSFDARTGYFTGYDGIQRFCS